MSMEALYWYLSIFLWLFFTGIGLPPFPEEAGIIYAAGLTALHSEVRWWGAWPATGLGIVCADMVLYWAGRLWGPRLFEYRWMRWLVNQERRQRVEGKFSQHGIKILLMARLLPPLRTGVFVTAGAIRYSFLRFLAADVGYAIIGVGLFFLGSTWLIDAVKWIGHVGHWAAYVVAALLGIYVLYRYYRFLKKREASGQPVPPISVLELPAGHVAEKK